MTYSGIYRMIAVKTCEEIKTERKNNINHPSESLTFDSKVRSATCEVISAKCEVRRVKCEV